MLEELFQDDTETVESIMGRGVQYEGTMKSENSLRINGIYRGSIECEDTLIVGSEANVEGDLVAEVAVIGGRVNGDVHARRRIEIRSTGEIFGDLSAPVMTIDEGVELKGNCTINTGEERTGEAEASDIKKKV